MKSSDIKVGEEYEIRHYGRAEVLAVEKRARRVFSGARHDWGGHISEGWVVDARLVSSGRTETVTPQQVLRPWSDAAADYEAKAKADARREAVVARLRDLGIAGVWADFRGDGIKVHLNVEQAEALADRL